MWSRVIPRPKSLLAGPELGFQRQLDEQRSKHDFVGWCFNAFAYSLLLERQWLQHGQPGLALAAGTQPLVAALLAALIAHRRWGRGFYMRWREGLALLAVLHLQWSVRLLAVHSNENIMQVFEDGGQPLFLLVMLAVNNGLVWVVLFTLYGQPMLPESLVALSVLALSSLLTTQPMCARALEAPGVVAPLADLYWILHFSHFAATPPGTADLLASQSRTPEQQCRVISNWLNLAGGVLLPLAILWRMERRARQLHQQRMRQVLAQRRGQPPAASQPPSEASRVCWWEQSAWCNSGCRWLASPARLFCLSSIIWIGAHL